MLVILETRSSMPDCGIGCPVRKDTDFVLEIAGGRESRDVLSWPGLPFSDESEISWPGLHFPDESYIADMV